MLKGHTPPSHPPEWWRAHPEIIDAVEAGHLGHLLTAWRQAHDPPISQDVAARWLCVSQPTVSRTEIRPTPDRDLEKLEHWCKTIGLPEDLWWFRAEARVGVPAGAGLDLPWTAAGARTATATVAQEDATVDRRMFLALGGAALTEVALDWLIAPAVPTTEHTGPRRRLLDTHVDHLDRIVGHLRELDDEHGGGAALAQAEAQLRHVARLLEECTYDDQVGRHLQASTAELLRVAGWAAFDDGHHATAQRYWFAGLRTAHAAGERALGANILGFLSCQAKDRGQHTEAVRFAEAARARHAGTSPRLTAILHMRAAQAHATVGDQPAALAATDAAGEAVRSISPAGDDPVWAYWMGEAHWREMAGWTAMTAGAWPHAVEHLAVSVDDATGRERAMRLAFLGRSLAHTDAVDQAVAVTGEAVDLLAGPVESARCVGHVHRAVAALDGINTAEVRGLRARAGALA